MSEKDLAYWGQFGITREILEKYKVNAISKMFSDGVLKQVYSEDNPMYSYRVFNSFKIYKPLANKSDKWRGNLERNDIQGFEQLNKTGDLLVITKALKDVMTLRSFGINAIAPPSESSILEEAPIESCRRRFSKIIMLYDRDKTGMLFTRKIAKKFNLDFVFINKKYEAKDISDFVKKYGRQSGKELLDYILKRNL
jgi:5S rRNA maturation endonuclease (ribonuclease M5)